MMAISFKTDSGFNLHKRSKRKDISKDGIVFVRCLEVDPDIRCQLEFDNFAEDLVGHNVDYTKDSLSLGKLEYNF
jgi:hypothetical protein